MSLKFVYVSPQIIYIFAPFLCSLTSKRKKKLAIQFVFSVVQGTFTFICIFHFIQFQMTVINFQFEAKMFNEWWRTWKNAVLNGTIPIMEEFNKPYWTECEKDTHPTGSRPVYFECDAFIYSFPNVLWPDSDICIVYVQNSTEVCYELISFDLLYISVEVFHHGGMCIANIYIRLHILWE